MNIATTILTNPLFDHIPANIHHGAYLKRQAETNFGAYKSEMARETDLIGCLCALFCLVFLGGGIMGLVFLAKWMIGI